MDVIGLLTLAAVAFVTIGDPVFVHILRARAPTAFSAAGQPKPAWILILTPLYFGAYMGYVLRRGFRAHLQHGSRLYVMANVLYVAHLILVCLGVFWACLLAWFLFR